MDAKSKRKNILLALLLTPAILVTAYSGYQIYKDSNLRADIKEDFSEVNSIEKGLLSVSAWESEIKEIIVMQIDSFELSPAQDSLLTVGLNEILNEVVDKAQSKVENAGNSFKGTMRKMAANFFVDWEGIRRQIPVFSEIIINEATKPESKERLKEIALQKLNEYTARIYDQTDSLKFNKVFERYGVENKEGLRVEVNRRAKILQNQAYNYTYVALAIVVLFLLSWFVIIRYPELHKTFFVFSVILALTVLLAGLTSPMIEIDARIKKVDFALLGQHVIFKDQILFYRSKSILQVVGLLIESSRIDSVFVGFLVLAFSVILPVSKLISTVIYLFTKGKKIHDNKLLKWLAFRSGKWSMADVMVVAIFMSYISFDGILDDQLTNFDMQTDTFSSIATNLTNLQPGFGLFVAFVVFGLILAAILKKITDTPKS